MPNMDQLVQSILSNSNSYDGKYDDDSVVSAATTKVSVHVQVNLGPARKRKKKKVRKIKNPLLLHVSSTSTKQSIKSRSRVVSNASSKVKVPAVVRKIKRKFVHRPKPKVERTSSVSSLETPAQNAAFLRKYYEETTRLANKKSSDDLVAAAAQSQVDKGGEVSNPSKKKDGKNMRPPWDDRFHVPSPKSSKRSVSPSAKKTVLWSSSQRKRDNVSTSKHETKKSPSTSRSNNKIRQQQQAASKLATGASSVSTKLENKKSAKSEESSNKSRNNQIGGASIEPKKSSDLSLTKSLQTKHSSTSPRKASIASKNPPTTVISGKESGDQKEVRKRVSFAGPAGSKVKPVMGHKSEHKSMRKDYGKGYQQKIMSNSSSTLVKGSGSVLSNQKVGEKFAEMPNPLDFSKTESADSNKPTPPHVSHLLRIKPLQQPPESWNKKSSDVLKPDHQFKNIEEVINSKFSGHAARLKSIWEKTPYQPMTHARFRDMVTTYASPEAVITFAKEGEHIKPDMMPENLAIKRIPPPSIGPAIPSNLLTLPRPWEIKELLAVEENKDKTLKQLQGPPRNWPDSESTYNRINYDHKYRLRKEAHQNNNNKVLREEVVAVPGKPVTK